MSARYDVSDRGFLAPALASLVFVDAPSSFLPDFGQGDRGTALEKSFEPRAKACSRVLS